MDYNWFRVKVCKLFNNYYCSIDNNVQDVDDNNNFINISYYYTTQAVGGPITKINQSKCSIAGQYSLSIGPGIVPNDPAPLVSL